MTTDTLTKNPVTLDLARLSELNNSEVLENWVERNIKVPYSWYTLHPRYLNAETLKIWRDTFFGPKWPRSEIQHLHSAQATVDVHAMTCHHYFLLERDPQWQRTEEELLNDPANLLLVLRTPHDTPQAHEGLQTIIYRLGRKQSELYTYAKGGAYGPETHALSDIYGLRFSLMAWRQRNVVPLFGSNYAMAWDCIYGKLYITPVPLLKPESNQFFISPLKPFNSKYLLEIKASSRGYSFNTVPATNG